MGLYRDRAGLLSAAQLGDALIFADTATLLLDSPEQAAGEAAAGSGPGRQPAGLAAHRAEIDQATGMLTEQLGVGIAEAYIRLTLTLMLMIGSWPIWPATSWRM